MPTSSPAIHPSRGIHSATTDWNSSDESETSPLNSRMAPAAPVAGHVGDDASLCFLAAKGVKLEGLKKQFLG